jgi:transposase
MILSNRNRRIFVANYVVDFRRNHDGLLAEAFKLNLNPFKGDVIIFIGRKRNRIKVLYSDETGLWLSSKKFTVQSMKTKFKFLIDPSFRKISAGELAMLLEGSAYTVEKKLNPYELPSALTKLNPLAESRSRA